MRAARRVFFGVTSLLGIAWILASFSILASAAMDATGWGVFAVILLIVLFPVAGPAALFYALILGDNRILALGIVVAPPVLAMGGVAITAGMQSVWEKRPHRVR